MDWVVKDVDKIVAARKKKEWMEREFPNEGW